MIERTQHLTRLRWLLEHNPVVAIIGARQVGKTTLATQLQDQWHEPCHCFDLERPSELARLADPELALEPLTGLVVLDEIQRLPNLFPLLRVLADRRPIRTRFLVLGSASPKLLRQGSETLAGRLATHRLEGFELAEIGTRNHSKLWIRGGFPASYLAATEEVSWNWRQEFIGTFLERDIPQLGIQISAPTLLRFWTMLAHYHGQVWNASEFARSFGVSPTSIRHYLDVLTSALVVRQVQPWYENLKKRQVKAPKVYLADSGMLHALLGIDSQRALESHPKLGASWEGFAMSQVIAHLGARANECSFWATHSGAELDLLINRGQSRWGFEFKRTSSPKATASMHTALADLALERLHLIHAGNHSFDLAENMRAIAFHRLLEDLGSF